MILFQLLASLAFAGSSLSHEDLQMALRSLSTVLLRKELARREKDAVKLAKRRDKVAKVLAGIENSLAAMGGFIIGVERRRGRPPGSKNKKRSGKRLGRPPGSKNKKRGRKSGSKRARNEMSLPDALAKAVRVGSTVSPAQAATAVKKAGYKSGSKTFGQAVAITLAKSSAFKRTGRGEYLRKGGSVAPAKRGPKPNMGRKTRKPSKRGRKTARRAVKTSRKVIAPKPAVAPTIAI